MRKSNEQDFWLRVDKTGGPDACWPWTRAKAHNGYGLVNYHGKQWRSHRLAYWFKYNELPLVVMHTCDNPLCCNLSHLKGGTHEDNMRDMCQKNRQARMRGELSPQHKLTEKDVLIIRSLYSQDGLNCMEIAKRYGVSSGHVSQIVTGGRWGHLPVPLSQRVRSYVGKLTDEMILAIRADYKTGLYSQRQLAKRYKVKSSSTICMVVHGKIRKHLPL